MERRKFIQVCCLGVIGIPLVSSILPSCGAIYYAQNSHTKNGLKVAKSEFVITNKKGEKSNRSFVLVKPESLQFPICLNKIDNENYTACLLECTHRNCELNVGGGIYSCPCHGSEFSLNGKLLQGPAELDLKTFITKIDNENIYITLL